MVYLGADHGGFELKEEVKTYLHQMGETYEDCGASSVDPGDDYPTFAFAVASKVAADPESKGILICRSGGGMTIAANKVKGIRALFISSIDEAIYAREINDANIMSIAAETVPKDDWREIVRTFIETDFSNEPRHLRRIKQIQSFEQEK